VGRRFPEALDRLTEIFLEAGLLIRLPANDVARASNCQEGRIGDDIGRSLHIIRVALKVMRDEIGLLVGEFAYCIRSGLDHLAGQLALLTTDNPSPDTAFPIYRVIPKSRNNSLRRRLVDIPTKAADIITSLQPYHAADRSEMHPLWQVNRICNIDQHQAIAVSYTQTVIRLDGDFVRFDVVPRFASFFS
jgi:hypothetical protein